MYEDLEAEEWVESRLLDHALVHWDTRGKTNRPAARRGWNWDNQETTRDFATEREDAFIQLVAAVMEQDPFTTMTRKSPRQKKRNGASRSS